MRFFLNCSCTVIHTRHKEHTTRQLERPVLESNKGEIMSADCKNHTEHVNKMCEKNTKNDR